MERARGSTLCGRIVIKGEDPTKVETGCGRVGLVIMMLKNERTKKKCAALGTAKDVFCKLFGKRCGTI